MTANRDLHIKMKVPGFDPVAFDTSHQALTWVDSERNYWRDFFQEISKGHDLELYEIQFV